MNVFDLISLLGGLALFLYGMRIMGDGLTRGSSAALKAAMEKVTNNPLVGFGLGLAVTAVIQSSTATIVLTSGLVGAGILTLHQSLGIILGANVGTTVTGQIIRLLDLNTASGSWLRVFQPSTLAPVALIIGILLLMAFHFRNSDTVGGILIGFGILFTGLLNMTAAVQPLSQSTIISDLFTSILGRPLLGFIAGAGVACLIQSSSASVGILQALAMTGQLSFGGIYSVLIGIYLGDCITTAIVCSIGAKADAKRTGTIHILFNLSMAVMIFVVVNILHSTSVLGSYWNSPISSGGIANTHTLFKFCGTIAMLPFCSLYEKLSRIIIKDDLQSSEDSLREKTLETLEPAFYASPELAISAAHGVIEKMAELSTSGVKNALSLFESYDSDTLQAIQRNESEIDVFADHVSEYLIHLSPRVLEGPGNDRLNYLIKSVSEFERIGDHAVNLSENVTDLIEKSRSFSPAAVKELRLITEAVSNILDYAYSSFSEYDHINARHIEPLEETIDDLVSAFRSNHVRRLRKGICNAEAGYIYQDVLVNLERISDHCSNMGMHTIMLHDTNAAEQQHDYVRSLHQGNDPDYNAEFNHVHSDYFRRLAQLDSTIQ